jgi:hypothetical protein
MYKPIYFIVCCLLISPHVRGEKKSFTDYQKKNQVPEPLFVDLVRGLDAQVGEWEINSLFYQTRRSFEQFQWAPEVEFVLRDGLAIEFEFPMVGRKLESYKLGLQQRVYQSPSGHHLQGIQFLYEADPEFRHSDGTLYYIIAQRFNHYFSIIGLYGFRTIMEAYQGLEWDLNQSFFYNYSQEIDFGLEFNYVSGELTPRFFQVVPQLHLAFHNGAIIQFGFGARTTVEGTRPLSTFRLIWEFNHW